MYSINCYIDKVIVTEKGIESIAIKPTGRSRVEGVDKRCLGFDCESKDDKKHKVSWFPLEVPVSEKWHDVILMARIYGKEVELKFEKPTKQRKSSVKEITI